ncbi:hypothetical protein BBJ28_00004982 [Nothophytophthora sp. Chile5]|nr:hypothetical protein BBJ28_00004982 [Nothophytophthora sp. Chile5]
MQWRDKRTPVNKETLDLDVAEGVLCNVVMDTFYRNFWTQRHWFAIRKVEGVYYNLDSKLSAPAVCDSAVCCCSCDDCSIDPNRFLLLLNTVQPFESERECYLYLQMLVHTGKCELFEITKTPSTEASSEPTPSS